MMAIYSRTVSTSCVQSSLLIYVTIVSEGSRENATDKVWKIYDIEESEITAALRQTTMIEENSEREKKFYVCLIDA